MLTIPTLLPQSPPGGGPGFALTGGAETAAVKAVSTTDPYDAIDTYIQEQMQRLNIPGVALAIVQGDRIVHARGFGKAHPAGQPPTPQTPFCIGSLTKSFTALAVMQLVEVGKIEPDAPVQRYLPWFRVADAQSSARMTVRHLLNQTSGISPLPGFVALGDFDSRPDAAARQVRALSTLELTRPVGTKFEYSNTNYNILGLIVEAASGESYADYIQKHIFEPLDMRRSYTSKTVAQQNGLATGYRYWFGFPLPARRLGSPRGSLASGQLISGAKDLCHYLIAHLNGGHYRGAQILSDAGIQELHRPAAEIREMGMSLGHYGMGWLSRGTGRSRVVWHSGIVPDFGAFMALVPEQNLGLVLLYNVNHAVIKMTFDEMGMGAVERLAGLEPAPTRFGAAPWLMRGMLLIPLLQIIAAFATLRRLRRPPLHPMCRAGGAPLKGRDFLLPLVPNLLAVLMLIPLRSKLRSFLKLYLPDFFWMSAICSSFAVAWSVLHTAFVMRTLLKR